MPITLPKAKYSVLPHIAMFTAAVIWAAVPSVAKLALLDISTATFLFFRLLLACVIVLPYLFFELKKNPIDMRDLPDIIVLGLASKASIFFVIFALNFTTAIDVSIISVIAPLLAFAAGVYFYREKISKIAMVGIALATVGTLVVVIEPVLAQQNIFGGGGKRLFGNLLALIYQFSWPIYIIMGKNLLGETSTRTVKALGFFHLTKLHKKYSPGLITSLTFFVALMVFMPLSLIEAGTADFTLNFTRQAIFGILFTSIFSTIIAYNLCTWAMEYLEVRETAPYQYISVVFAIPMANLLLGEVLTKITIIGALVIAAGVIIAEKFKS